MERQDFNLKLLSIKIGSPVSPASARLVSTSCCALYKRPVAVKNALRLGAIGFDAVKHLVLCHVEKRPPKLDLDVYPYLPKANVGTTSAASYMSLMRGRAA